MSHFYEKTASGIEPRHFVPMAKDPSKLRPSRVTDARKALKNGEVWYPSVTTVLNVLDKPALVNWKVDQHLQTIFESEGDELNPVMFNENYGEWLRLVKNITQDRMDLAPKAGTDIHQVLEDFIGKGVAPSDDLEMLICENVVKALRNNCGEIEWECEKYFVDESFGYAGCADLVGSGGSHDWVIDYKSKLTADKFKPGKMVYPEHYRQLAAYEAALFDSGDERRANIFICLETGEVDFHEHPQEKSESGWEDFKDCLSIYKRNTYNPLESL